MPCHFVQPSPSLISSFHEIEDSAQLVASVASTRTRKWFVPDLTNRYTNHLFLRTKFHQCQSGMRYDLIYRGRFVVFGGEATSSICMKCTATIVEETGDWFPEMLVHTPIFVCTVSERWMYKPINGNFPQGILREQGRLVLWLYARPPPFEFISRFVSVYIELLLQLEIVSYMENKCCSFNNETFM